LKRYHIRLTLFIVLFVSILVAWSYFKGLPFTNVPAWVALPPDIPLMLSYPDFRLGWNQESGVVGAEIAFSASLQGDAELLGDVLRLWQHHFDLPQPISMTLGLHPAGLGQTAFSLILDNPNRGLNPEKLLEDPKISRTSSSAYRGITIHTVNLQKGKSFSVAFYRNLIIVSRLPLWVEEAAGRLSWRPSGLFSSEDFKKMLPPKNQNQPSAHKYLFVQTSYLAELLDGVIHQDGLKALDYALSKIQWIRLDFSRHDEAWQFRGTAKTVGNHHLKTAKEVVSAALLEVVPDHITMLFLGNTAHFPQLASTPQKQFVRKYIAPWAGTEFAIALGHTKGIGLPDDWFGLISMRKPELAEEKLAALAASFGLLDDYEYQTFRVRQIMTEDVLPFFPSERMKNPYFTFLGNFAVFASSRAAMEIWIDGFVTGQTLLRDEEFLHLYGHGKQPGEWFLYLPNPQLQNLLQSYALQESSAKILSELIGTLALRGNQKDDLFELSGGGTTITREPRIQPTIAWKVLLNAPAATAPFPVFDRQKKETLLLVQDSLFRLYLLGPAGEIRWTRNLDGLMLSDIKSIGFYNDGSSALLFNTANHIYILNSKGEDIGNFPLQLQSPATAGVTLANFEGGQQQTFFVPCANGNIYGFDKLGTPLPGWNPLPGNGVLRFPIMHFQDAERDFLVALSENGLIKVFRKDGIERFPPIVTDGVFLSAPDFQVSSKSSRIVAMNNAGMAHIIGLDGTHFRLACPAGRNKAVRFAFGHWTGDERKDYAVLDANVLAVYAYQKTDKFAKILEHRFDAPQDEIFCLRMPGEATDRIGAFNRKSGKIHLLDGTGTPAPGFPLAGNTRFFPADLFNNGKHCIVTSYGESVYAYQLD
jgi:hypothetical protein